MLIHFVLGKFPGSKKTSHEIDYEGSFFEHLNKLNSIAKLVFRTCA